MGSQEEGGLAVTGGHPLPGWGGREEALSQGPQRKVEPRSLSAGPGSTRGWSRCRRGVGAEGECPWPSNCPWALPWPPRARWHLLQRRPHSRAGVVMDPEAGGLAGGAHRPACGCKPEPVLSSLEIRYGLRGAASQLSWNSRDEKWGSVMTLHPHPEWRSLSFNCKH